MIHINFDSPENNHEEGPQKSIEDLIHNAIDNVRSEIKTLEIISSQEPIDFEFHLQEIAQQALGQYEQIKDELGASFAPHSARMHIDSDVEKRIFEEHADFVKSSADDVFHKMKERWEMSRTEVNRIAESYRELKDYVEKYDDPKLQELTSKMLEASTTSYFDALDRLTKELSQFQIELNDLKQDTFTLQREQVQELQNHDFERIKDYENQMFKERVSHLFSTFEQRLGSMLQQAQVYYGSR